MMQIWILLKVIISLLIVRVFQNLDLRRSDFLISNRNFRFLISIFEQNFDFRPGFDLPTFGFRKKNRFLSNISIFYQNFDLSTSFDIWPEYFDFSQDFDFGPKFLFSTKISIFDQNFYSQPKFRFSTKISIFDQNFDFRPGFDLLTFLCKENSIFV